MGDEMKTDMLIKSLDEMIKKYSERIESLIFDFDENKRYAQWSLTLRLLKIEFVYTKKEKTDCPVSTLFCRIYLQKNSNLSYHIPEIVDFLDIDDFKCYYFSYIENKKRLKACFNTITDFIDEHFDRLNMLALEPDKYKEKKVNYLKEFFDVKDKDIPTQEEERIAYFDMLFDMADWYMIMRFTNFNAYELFLKGQYSKSIRKYQKLKTRFPYEQKLMDFMISRDGEYYPAIASECAAAFDAKKYNASGSGFMIMLLSWLIGMIGASIPFAIAILIFNAIFQSKTIYCDTFSVLDSILFGSLPGIVIGLTIKNKIAGFIHKNVQQVDDFDDILMPQSTKTGLKVFCAVVCVAVVIFFAFVLKPVIIAYDDYFLYYDNEKEFSSYQKYEYDDIESLYHIDGRYNPYSDYIKRGSYVIKMKDSTVIDTDAFNNPDKVNEDILEKITKKEVINVHSDRDIE